MSNLTNIEFSAWQDDKSCRCRFSANTSNSELRSFDFYMSNHEWSSFAYGKLDNLKDCFMHLSSMTELCSIYRLEIPYDKMYGSVSVPFVNFNFPLFVRKILLRWAKSIWTMNPDAYKEKFGWNRPAIKIDDTRLNRWFKIYGIGSGNVEVIMNEPCKIFLEENLAKDNLVKDSQKTLRYCLEHVKKCAGNCTNAFFQTSKVYLMKDWGGFYFQIKNNMNGGIVNHGKEIPSWSIHT